MGGGAGILAGLIGGAGNALGEHFDQKAAEKRTLSDEERQAKYQQLTDGIGSAQGKLATLKPDSPEYKQTMDDITKAHQDLTDLFHPSQGPGALAHLGQLVSQHILHHKAAPQAPLISSTPGVAAVPAATAPGMTPGTTMSSPALPAAPGHTFTPPPLSKPEQLKRDAAEFMTRLGMEGTPQAVTNQYSEYRKQLKEAIPSISDEDLDKAVMIHAGASPKPGVERPVMKAYQLPGGLVEYYDATKPDDIPEGATAIVPGSTVKPSQAGLAVYTRALFGEHPTAQQIEVAAARYKQAQTPTTTGSHEVIQYDADNNPHLVTEETSSSKHFPGAGGLGLPPVPAAASAGAPAAKPGVDPSAPKKPGPLKSAVRAIASGAAAAGGGRVSPALPGLHRNSPAETTAAKDVVAATKVASLADQALTANSAVQQKQLVLAMIRGLAGRVNMQEYDILTQKAGLGNSIEQWANNLTSGKLPDDILKQLVGAAHANLKSAEDAQLQARAPVGSTPSPGAAPTHPIVVTAEDMK